jgi:hypothetical protein
MNKHQILLLFLVFMIIGSGSAQTSTIRIGAINACYDSQISVPVYLIDATAMGALSLEIHYDANVVEFMGIEDLHGDFETVKYNNITEPEPAILISWVDHSGVDIDSAAIFNLTFNYSASSGSLDFSSNCELANTSLGIIETEFINGWVSPSISITSQPADSTVTPPGSAGFQVIANGGTQFQWQQSPDGSAFTDLTENTIFQGVNSQSLIISETDMTLDSTFYRCIISNNDCELVSEIAALNFEGTKYQHIILKEGWTSLSSYVMPLDDNLENVMESISNSLAFMMNDEGYLDPQTGTNTLGGFNPFSGYAIKLSQSDTLYMAGLKLDSLEINIPEGWSYLPALSECNITVIDLFGVAISDVIIIKEIAGNKVFWPEKDIETLTVLEPGKAYLIKASANMQTVFPECTGK